MVLQLSDRTRKLSSNSYQELDYFIFCVTDDNYIENTYVTLHSFYQFNDLPVTVFVLGNKTDRFNEFPKVTIKYLELDFNAKHQFYANIKPVIAKLKIFDDSNHQYNLSFDTDTLFTGSISDTLKEYQGTFIGVDEPEKHEINAGFIILKKVNFSLFERFKEFTTKHGLPNCPEQDFLNFIFKDNKSYLDTKYNVCQWTDKTLNSEPVMIHYAGTIKPFAFNTVKYEYLNKAQFKLFKYYYTYCRYLTLSKEFREKLIVAERKYELFSTLLHYHN